MPRPKGKSRLLTPEEIEYGIKQIEISKQIGAAELVSALNQLLFN